LSSSAERHHCAFPARRGVVLILVLVVVAILSLAGYGFLEMMWSERKAASMAVKQAQARELAASGVEMAKVFLGQDADVILQAGGWYNNPGVFRGVLVTDNTAPNSGRFSFMAPNFEGGMPAGIRYGLENESAKINLNLLLYIDQKNQGAGRTMLLNLPGMTEDIADCIMDWIDSDDTEREFGAESDYYMSQSPPYTTANAVPQNLDELLLVKGVTPSLLFGADANRNGQIDPSEQSLVQNQTGNGTGSSTSSGSGTSTTSSTTTSTNSSSNSSSSGSGTSTVDGEVNLGWAAYLTVNSAEANVQSDGTPKVNLNQSNLQQLYSQLQDILEADQAAYIILYELQKSGGEAPPAGGQSVSASAAIGGVSLSAAPVTPLSSVLDLIGATVTTTVTDNGKQTTATVKNPFSSDTGAMASYLPTLMEQTTTSSGTTVYPPRININLAPQTVLEAIPGMTDEIVQAIMEKRQDDPTNEPPDHLVETWLLTDGVVTLAQMKALEPYVTCGGNIYRGQVVGYFDGGGPAARIEVMIDATVQPANVVSWREISHLGRGFALSDLSGDQGSSSGSSSSSGSGGSNAGAGAAPSGK
jgi:uncharacterized membrane protein YgcG